MRDGIPKTIPVPRKWQRFVECADRPADRGTKRVVDRLIDAVRETFAKYFPSEDRKLLKSLCDESQSTLPGIAIPPNPDTSFKNWHLAELFAEAKNAVHRGQNHSIALKEALAAKIESDVAAHMRQISEDLAAKCRPNELKRVRAEMDRAAAEFDANEEARQMLGRMETIKNALQPDEDIR